MRKFLSRLAAQPGVFSSKYRSRAVSSNQRRRVIEQRIALRGAL